MRPGNGLGVLLGPRSGIVDVECDSPEAEVLLQEILGEIPLTPTFSSTRGKHFLFQWNENWPVPEKAVFKIGALEFRTGNAKAAQSVFPPTSGRKWLVDPSTPLAVFSNIAKVLELYNANHRRKEFTPTAFERTPTYGDGETLDVPKWLDKHGVLILGRDNKADVTRWYIECPHRNLHTTPDAVKDCCVTQEADGRLGGHCFHQSCGMSTWEALRDAIGPLEFSDYHDSFDEYPGIDISGILNQTWASKEQEKADVEQDSDEDFCTAMVPARGLLRSIFDFYCDCAYRESSVMGLAVAVSLCETLFGRRVRSHTDLRTNDYNVVLAPTGSGKETCETTITKILAAVEGGAITHMYPPDIQSGNGLMHAISKSPCGIWVCDEFGKILAAVLDKKGNQHIKQIGNHLLKLYGKSSGVYGGAAHSDGVRNQVIEPHLVLLGMATPGSVFECVSNENVSDGLLGRIAFWPVQERPTPKEEMTIATPSEGLVAVVKEWVNFRAGGNLGAEFPDARTILMSVDAKERWNEHAKQINERMGSESESRAAIWARVAARSMKLALVHRCARLETPPSTTEWGFVYVEIQDVNWAIKLSNWLAKISCGLVRETTIDKNKLKAKQVLEKAVEAGPVKSRDILRMFRGLTSGDLMAAANELGFVVREVKNPRGSSSVIFEKAGVA